MYFSPILWSYKFFSTDLVFLSNCFLFPLLIFVSLYKKTNVNCLIISRSSRPGMFPEPSQTFKVEPFANMAEY